MNVVPCMYQAEDLHQSTWKVFITGRTARLLLEQDNFSQMGPAGPSYADRV